MSDHSIRLVFDPQRTKLSTIAHLMGRIGYQLSPLDRSRDQHIQQESKRLLVQIAIAGFLAANSMWIAVALYAGEFSGVVFEYRYFLGLVGTALGTLAVAGPGRTFFVGALASLKSRTPHMDLPIAVGLSVGTVVGMINGGAGVSVVDRTVDPISAATACGPRRGPDVANYAAARNSHC
jgi:Cu2+-exporting ATPase